MHDMICFVLQFDSGIQRFMSMRATEYDHFRPTPKTSLYGLCVIVIPMLAFGYWVKTTRVRYSHFSTVPCFPPIPLLCCQQVSRRAFFFSPMNP